MRAAPVYLTGLALIGVAGAGLVLAVAPDIRDEIAWSFLMGLAIQAPLGWWTVQSIGTRRFQLVWSMGMLVRLAIVGLAGLALVPALGWRMGPALGTLVAVMVGLLLVEAVAAVREHSWD
jgi:hypothetical protein